MGQAQKLHRDGVLEADRLLELSALEGSHFWFVERRRLVLELLTNLAAGSVVLDVGSGTGTLGAALAAGGFRVVAVDKTTDLLEPREAIMAVSGDAEKLPLKDGKFDAVLLLDVLEHTDDRAVLGEARRVAAPGSLLVVTVPAFGWLWSVRDDLAGHRRRYTRSTLRRRIAEAGLQVEVLYYWQRILFPIVALSRLAGRRSLRTRNLEEHPPKLVNALFRAASGVDRKLGAHLAWLPGSSVVALCRVP